MLSGIMGLFSMFLAGGGHVTGPGTGTSDSIPAMLSNGEYVVRAASTRKFLPLLEAINTGRLPAFALGGPVGALPNLSGLSGIESANQGTQITQQFDITITGDISRQTRREVLGMIPEIASGVHQHNYEQNVR